jgi:transcriptional regulator with XRE-family HTH domain
MDVKAIAERVKEIREVRGWSLRQWAERAGVSHTWIAHVEAADRDTVDLNKLLKLAAAAQVPLSDMLGVEAYEDNHRYADLDELTAIVMGLGSEDRNLVMTVARRLHVLQQLQERGVRARAERPLSLREGQVPGEESLASG